MTTFSEKKNLQKKYEYNTADSLSGIPSAVYELFKVKDETRQKISPNKCIICATFPPPTIRLHPGTLLQFPVKNPCVCHFPEIKYRFLYIYIFFFYLKKKQFMNEPLKRDQFKEKFIVQKESHLYFPALGPQQTPSSV